VLTPTDLKTNSKLVESITYYPRPQNVKQIKQFLGLNRRFIKNFANIAQPLHALTRTGVEFCWTEQCQEAFSSFKRRLTTAPVLHYPSVDFPFILETDASIKGLGAILSQAHDDRVVHPVAYASRS